MKRCILNRAFLSAMILLAMQSVSASDLVYTPLNPTFGGNPGNAAMLMSNAQTQNTYKAPQPTPLERFNTSLQQSILNRIQAQAVNTMFAGAYKLTPGSYDTGQYNVTVTQNADGTLTVVTTDNTTGAAANFVVSPGI